MRVVCGVRLDDGISEWFALRLLRDVALSRGADNESEERMFLPGCPTALPRVGCAEKTFHCRIEGK